MPEAPDITFPDENAPGELSCEAGLEEMLLESLEALSSLLEALDLWEQASTVVNREHLRLVTREARRLFTYPDIDQFLTRMYADTGDLTFTLLRLMADYLETTDDPNQFFGPDAPDQGATLMAAVRWGVSEGRLTLADAERLQAQIARVSREIHDSGPPQE